MKMIEKIKNEWNKPVGVETNETPTVIHRDKGMLMFKLMYEELLEFKDAIQNNDLTDKEKIVEIADALGDLQYLLYGTVSQYGLDKKFPNILEEIHRSNSTKLQDGKIKFRDDGKVLKPDTFELPNLNKVIYEKE